MQKANQLVAVVCTDKVASARELTIEFFGLVETSSVISIRHSLSKRRLVVHFPYLGYQLVIKFFSLHHHTTLRGPPHVFPRFLREALPPLLETSQADSRNALIFKWISILGLRCGRLLSESKNV